MSTERESTDPGTRAPPPPCQCPRPPARWPSRSQSHRVSSSESRGHQHTILQAPSPKSLWASPYLCEAPLPPLPYTHACACQASLGTQPAQSARSTQHPWVRLQDSLSLQGAEQPDTGAVTRDKVQAPLDSFPIWSLRTLGNAERADKAGRQSRPSPGPSDRHSPVTCHATQPRHLPANTKWPGHLQARVPERGQTYRRPAGQAPTPRVAPQPQAAGGAGQWQPLPGLELALGLQP